MQEKRKFSRCGIKERILIIKEDNNQEALMILNVSMNGMMILLNGPTEIGSKISGKFKISPCPSYFFMKGEVIWAKPAVDEIGNSYGYFAGAKFTKVSTIPLEND